VLAQTLSQKTVASLADRRSRNRPLSRRVVPYASGVTGQQIEAPGGIDPRRRSRRLWWLLVVPVVLALIGLGWYKTAAAARSELEVTQSRPIHCRGTAVQHRRVAPDAPAMDVIHAKAGMVCTLVVRYRNDSGRSVHISAASFAVLGPSADALAHMPGAAGSGAAPNDDTVPANFSIDRTVRAGESFTATYPIVFNPHGCGVGRLWMTRQPTVSVSALGLSGEIRGGVSLGIAGNYDGCPRS
jgi:hypothetical protein